MQTKRMSCCVGVLVLLLAMPAVAVDGPHRVKPASTGTGDCSDWANACTLPFALGLAQVGEEVWVSAGTYAPIPLVNGVKIIGGFAGTETAASQSDPGTNDTVLDGGSTGQVVVSQNDAASTMLRGFRIIGGYDDSGLLDNGGGGAIALTNSSAMIVQCIFENNTAAVWGAAVLVDGTGSPEFINCTFRNNGAVVLPGETDPTTPLAGGAVFVRNGSPRFTNCLFHDNTGLEAGGIANDGGTPTLINCTLANNSAVVGGGGGVHDSHGTITAKNCIFWGSAAVRGGDQILNYPGRFTKATKSNIQGGLVGTGNIDSDPQFESPGQSNYKLSQSSPCKNKGQTFALPPDVADLDWDGNTTEKVPFDLNGDPRKVEFVVDMGAYETPLDPGPQ